MYNDKSTPFVYNEMFEKKDMQTSLETTLANLIAIPSVSENTAACLEIITFVKSEVAALGLHIIESSPDAGRPWFIATTKQTLTPDILLAAHLDVVPGATALFTMRHHGDKLVGRGVYDMKLAAACYLEFLKKHADILHTLNIGLLFSSDEEIGGDSMLDIIATGLRPGVIFIPDGGGDWQVEARAKGLFGIKLFASGKAAHGSRPWEGENALHPIMDVVHALRHEHPLKGPDDATLAITGIKGGQAVNQIADSASAHLDFRSFDDQELLRFKERVFELSNEHGIEATIVQSGSPVIFDKHHPAVQPFLHAMEEVRGEPVSYVDSYGGTDARYFAPYNIPCIIMEPHGGGRHAGDEWLKTEDLSTYYTLIERWVLSAAKETAAQLQSQATVS